MYKNNFSSESANHQSTTLRTGKPFLMKAAVEGKSFPCSEFNFDQTLECPRVIRLQDYLYGLEELTEEQAYKLNGNQPVFYLQERFIEEHQGYEWNGFILFRFNDKQEARKVAIEHAEELNIALAFDSPLDNRYYILVKTAADKFNEKSRTHFCYKHKAVLQEYLPKPHWMDLDYFVRAFTTDHYDVVNKDMLFGKAESLVLSVESDNQQTSLNIHRSSLNTHRSTLNKIKSFFSHLFRHSA